MSERFCIRGCTKPDVHYASCEHHGPDYTGQFPCPGCAPRECRDGSLICDRCFGRMRHLLSDIFDLLGRLRSLADPSKATPMDEAHFRSTTVEAKAPAGVDLLDALHAVEAVASVWEAWGMDLRKVQNDLGAVEYFGAHVLDRHPAVDGLRTAWSVQDAVDQWGVERREKNRRPFEDDADERAEIATPVREWNDPILTRAEAEEVAGSPRTLSRWIKDGLIAPEGRMVIAGVPMLWFRCSDVMKVRTSLRAKMAQTQFKTTDSEDGR